MSDETPVVTNTLSPTSNDKTLIFILMGVMLFVLYALLLFRDEDQFDMNYVRLVLPHTGPSRWVITQPK